jgi:hypothetical protein
MGHRTATPESERILCSRCDKCANPTDGWENGWPLYGRLDIGFPAQAFGHLGRCNHCADAEHFEWWREGHPAMTVNEAQAVTFEWGNGHQYDSRGRYRLCYDCQKELLHVLGDFFGIPQRVAELKQHAQGKPE